MEKRTPWKRRKINSAGLQHRQSSERRILEKISYVSSA
nr:MAG TPA: hypothetical protein [Caudoviricetes sp.]